MVSGAKRAGGQRKRLVDWEVSGEGSIKGGKKRKRMGCGRRISRQK